VLRANLFGRSVCDAQLLAEQHANEQLFPLEQHCAVSKSTVFRPCLQRPLGALSTVAGPTPARQPRRGPGARRGHRRRHRGHRRDGAAPARPGRRQRRRGHERRDRRHARRRNVRGAGCRARCAATALGLVRVTPQRAASRPSSWPRLAVSMQACALRRLQSHAARSAHGLLIPCHGCRACRGARASPPRLRPCSWPPACSEWPRVRARARRAASRVQAWVLSACAGMPRALPRGRAAGRGWQGPVQACVLRRLQSHAARSAHVLPWVWGLPSSASIAASSQTMLVAPSM
jgi:hypothetical protein